MRLAGAQASGRNDLAGVARLESGDDDGRQAHDRAVARAGRAHRIHGHARVCAEVPQGARHLVADIETHARRRAVALRVPALVAFHHVKRIVTALRQQRIRQAQRHRRVVCPLAWFEVEDASADHVRDRFERTRRLKLVRRAQCVANRQAHQGTARARKKIHHAHSVPQAARAWVHACAAGLANDTDEHSEGRSLPVKL